MEQSEGTFHEASNYFDLFDVMKGCSSSKPHVNSEELDEIIAKPLSSDDDDNSFIGNDNVIHPDNQNDDNTESQDNSHPNSQTSNNTIAEVVSTSTTADVVPVTTPLLMKWKKDNERRSTTSIKNHHKCRDDMDMDTFFKYQKEASCLKKHPKRNQSNTRKRWKKLNK